MAASNATVPVVIKEKSLIAKKQLQLHCFPAHSLSSLSVLILLNLRSILLVITYTSQVSPVNDAIQQLMGESTILSS